MATPQNNAITAAQNLASLMAQYEKFMLSVNAWANDNAKNNWDQYWIAMPTIAVNADGSLGSADGTLNNAHPINVPAVGPLLLSRNQLISGVNLVTVLQGLAGWTTGTVTAPNQNPLITAAQLAPNTLG